MTDTNDTTPESNTAGAESNTTGPENADAPLHRRGIKSYVIRAGRMTPAQSRGLEDVWPRLGLTIADGRQDLDTLFRPPSTARGGNWLWYWQLDSSSKPNATQILTLSVSRFTRRVWASC